MTKIGDVSVGISGDASGLRAAGKLSEEALRGIAGQFSALGPLASRAGVAFTGVGAAAIGMAGAIKTASDGLRIFAGLEKALNRVGAVSGATESQMESLSDVARELGATTAFTAQEAAEGMAFLAMAGQDVNTIIGAMPAVLQLAASAQVGLGEAADTVTNIMAGFGKTAEELSGVNDVLVQTFTNANVTLGEMGEAFKVVGPIAKGLGVTFEDTAAAVGVLGNAGIKASLAGTGLKRALSALVKASPQARKAMDVLGVGSEDAGKGFASLIKKLESARRELSAEEFTGKLFEAFGERGGPILAALVEQGSASIVDLADKLKNSLGRAAAIQRRQMDGLAGDVTRLRSASDALSATIGRKLAPAARAATQSLTELAQGVNQLLEATTTFDKLAERSAKQTELRQETALALGRKAAQVLSDLEKAEKRLAFVQIQRANAARAGNEEATDALLEQEADLIGVVAGFREQRKELVKLNRAFKAFREGGGLFTEKGLANLKKAIAAVGKTGATTAKLTGEGQKAAVTFGQVLKLVEAQASAAERVSLARTVGEAAQAAGALRVSNLLLEQMKGSGDVLVDTFEAVARAFIKGRKEAAKLAAEVRAARGVARARAQIAGPAGGVAAALPGILGVQAQAIQAAGGAAALPPTEAERRAEEERLRKEEEAAKRAAEALTRVAETSREAANDLAVLRSDFPALEMFFQRASDRLVDLAQSAAEAGEAAGLAGEAERDLKRAIAAELAERLNAMRASGMFREALVFAERAAEDLGIGFDVVEKELADIDFRDIAADPGPGLEALITESFAGLAGAFDDPGVGKALAESLGASVTGALTGGGVDLGGMLGSALGAAAPAIGVSAGGAIGAAVASVVTSLATAAVERIGAAVGPMLRRIGGLIAADPTVAGAFSAFAESFVPVMAALPIVAFGLINLASFIAVGAAMFPALTTAVGALSLALGALFVSAGSVIFGFLAFPGIMAGLAGSFLFLITKTQTFADITGAIGFVIEQTLLPPIDAFAQNLVFLVGIAQDVAAILNLLVVGFGDGESASRALFETFKFLTIFGLEAAITSLKLNNALITFGQAVLTGGIKFLDVIEKIAKALKLPTGKLNDFQDALINARSNIEDFRVDTSDAEDALEAFKKKGIEEQTETGQDAIDAFRRSRDAVDEATDSFTALTETAANLPQFFRRAALVGGATLPGAGETVPSVGGVVGEAAAMAGAPTIITVERVELQAQDPMEFLRQIEALRDREAFLRHGTPVRGARAGSAGA